MNPLITSLGSPLVVAAAPDCSRIVGPAYHPAPTPMKIGALRPLERRLGAYDYRDVPSRMGNQRVAFVSSLTIDAGSDAE